MFNMFPKHSPFCCQLDKNMDNGWNGQDDQINDTAPQSNIVYQCFHLGII